MTLANPKPLGWAFGELLTSTQMNSFGTQLVSAVDGSGGGSYTLSSPLTLAGALVSIANLAATTLAAPTITGSVNIAADLVVGDDLSVADDALISGTLEVGQNAILDDTLSVAGAATVGGTLGVTGVTTLGTASSTNFGAPLASIVALTASGYLRLHAGTGWDGSHNVTINTDPQFITVTNSDISAASIWTILDTGTNNGDFFVFFNKNTTYNITINAPSGTICTITPGNTGFAWRTAGVWRGTIFSAT